MVMCISCVCVRKKSFATCGTFTRLGYSFSNWNLSKGCVLDHKKVHTSEASHIYTVATWHRHQIMAARHYMSMHAGVRAIYAPRYGSVTSVQPRWRAARLYARARRRWAVYALASERLTTSTIRWVTSTSQINQQHYYMADWFPS
jgi:hypothetical protein